MDTTMRTKAAQTDEQRAPAVVGHMVVRQPAGVFLGVVQSPGRLPIRRAQRVGQSIHWVRDDGKTERVDFSGSVAAPELIQAFQSEDGLLLVSYDALGANPSLVDVAYLGGSMSAPAQFERGG